MIPGFIKIEEEKQSIAIIALRTINDLLSPSYIIDNEGRERLRILQSYFLDQLQDKKN